MKYFIMKFLGLVLFLATAVLAKHEQYRGWKSYYVAPTTKEQVEHFYTVVDRYNLNVISRPLLQREGVISRPPLQREGVISRPLLQREGVILVRPEHQELVTKALNGFGITFDIHVDDVRAALDQDEQKILKKRVDSILRNGGKQVPYDNYQDLEVIYEYLQNIAKRHPDLVTLVSPGNSFEDLPIYYLKISTTNFEDESKPVIFIDAAIHAREWITVPPVTWAIHKLVENVTEPDLLERFDWIILPVVNPDGYKHSFDVERFWRKTRSTDTNVIGPTCPGVDGNRNYDYEWNTIGTSPIPCSDTYAGNQAFSEIETRIVRDLLFEHLHRIALYLTMHSYGSLILYPWGADGTLPNNALAMHTVGVAMAQEIDKASLGHFPDYIVGNSALVIYATSGSSEDYAHLIGVPLSYTLELPGLSGGLNGFHLDPQYVEQVSQETWEGIVAGARGAGDLFEGIIVP